VSGGTHFLDECFDVAAQALRLVVELNTTLVSVARASGWSVGTLNRLSSGKLSPFPRVFSDVEQTLGLSPWPEIRPRLRRKNVLVPRRQTA
jgi:hypothetical protein